MPRKGYAFVRGTAGGTVGAGYFGSGDDGDVTISTATALPVPLDEGQIIKQYESLIINEGGSLYPANRCNGMIILVRGDCTISGHLHADQCAPFANDAEETAANDLHIRFCGENIGGQGGHGGSTTEAAGGAGTAGLWCGGGWPGGGGGGVGGQKYNLHWDYGGSAGGPGTRPVHGMSWPVAGSTSSGTAGTYGAGGTGAYVRGGVGGASPGGAGGAGYIYDVDNYGAEINGGNGNGYPGGALWLFVGGSLTITPTGIISADGGNGGNAGTRNSKYYGGGGGGAGGGIVCVVYGGIYTNTGTIQAKGGLGGAGGSNGQAGTIGTVFVHSISDLLG